MKIKQSQIEEALGLTLEHYDEDDIRLRNDYHGRWGYTAPVAVVGSKSALEEFELYLATLIITPYLDDEVEAYALIKAIMDVRELRHEDEVGRDDIVYFYPQFELV